MRALLAEQNQKMQLLLEEVAQLRAEISSAKKRSQEGQEVNQAASKMALEVYVEMSDWALKSSGATIDMQRTSETYSCKENWGCRVLWFFRPANPPDAILQPDLSPGDCWPFQGPQGQVVIRLPARVHLAGRHDAAHLQRRVSIWDRRQRPQRRRCLWSGCGRRRGNSPWDVHVQRGKRGHSDLPSEGHQTSREEQLGKPSVHLHLSSAGSREDGSRNPRRKSRTNVKKQKADGGGGEIKQSKKMWQLRSV
ncbi:SUN domain-containing protein 5-like isoform X2 [Aquila chrysaetos chrysaetos]|uniref:SUN domain-containing protein 5-like isoform X2 n=1 Tax=Aquila chrysaetos chrysaetos TaxID=223781 RepID=UPI001B7D3A4E|nr:SUN domain-containing protein 5-like isoform X2 [Aquila chrysaetos chrysaetos]